VTTRGGLIVIGAAAEQTLRALDVRTGHELCSPAVPTRQR
jgi:quinoprotein glucose dehydrogenase